MYSRQLHLNLRQVGIPRLLDRCRCGRRRTRRTRRGHRFLHLESPHNLSDKSLDIKLRWCGYQAVVVVLLMLVHA